MKQYLLSVLAAAVVLPVHAQLFSPESVTGGVIGAIAGGVIGHNNGRHAGEGAAIGAGVGLLAGALVHQSNHRDVYYSAPPAAYVTVSSPGYYHRHGWAPRPAYRPVYVQHTYAAPVVTTQVVTTTSVITAPAPAPAPVTIINNYYTTAPATP